MQFLFHKWDKVSLNRPSKICGRQHSKNFTWSILEYVVNKWHWYLYLVWFTGFQFYASNQVKLCCRKAQEYIHFVPTKLDFHQHPVVTIIGGSWFYKARQEMIQGKWSGCIVVQQAVADYGGHYVREPTSLRDSHLLLSQNQNQNIIINIG